MVTEAHQKLARLNEQILESAGEGIYGLDLHGTITFVNPAGAKMLGYEPEELHGMPSHSTIHHTRPDGSPYRRQECPMYSVFKDGIPRHLDSEVFWRKNGTFFPIECVATPLREEGQIVGAVVTFQDITERTLAQKAHERFCEQIEKTLESLPGAILVVNKHHRVIYANSESHRHFDPKDSQFLGTYIFDVLPFTTDQWNRLADNFLLQPSKGAGMRKDLEFETRDHTYCYCLFPIPLEGQDVTQIGLLIWDITERKKLQDQIIQSEKLSGLGTLVSSMAHEVRSPMQAIIGVADLLMQEDDPQIIQELAGDLKRVGTHIASILTDFMTYARPSSQDHFVELDLNDRLREAWKMVQRNPNFEHVEVEQHLTPLPLISVRQAEIDQVFINLITNAAQAMRGNGRLKLASFLNDNLMTIQISDTGCGIPKEILNKIFEPFFSTKEKGKGTGLGLNIVQQIVKRYEGHITVTSLEGKGTTFTIQLPPTRIGRGYEEGCALGQANPET